MASKPDLVKIGEEGFAIIDEHFGWRRRPSRQVLPPPQRAPAAANAATTFHANHPHQICYQRYQPQESYLIHQPQESTTVRVNKAFAAEATQPQESYLVYRLQESNTVRVNKTFATEATVVSGYQYEAYAKSVEYMPVMDYQGPPFHMRYN